MLRRRNIFIYLALLCLNAKQIKLIETEFVSGMPDVELGINDMWRQGKEVVGRHDIIPVVTEEWIRLENVEFHACVQQDEYEKSRIIKYVLKRLCHNRMRLFNSTNTNKSNEFS